MRREFTHAVDVQKPAIAMVHVSVVPSAAFAERVRIVFDPADSAAGLLKLMQTVNQWKRTKGRSFEIELEPPEVGNRLNDEDPANLCEYRVMREHEPTPWYKASFWHEVGGAFAYLRGIPEDAKVEVRVRLGDEKWRSRFRSLTSRVVLEREI